MTTKLVVLSIALAALAAHAGDVAPPSPIPDLVRQMEGDDFDARETATQVIERLGDAHIAELRAIHAATQNSETKVRLGRLLDRWAPGSVVWSVEDGPLYQLPCIKDGHVYVGNKSNRFHCYDAESGRPEWVFDVGGFIYKFPAVAEGRVFVIRTRKDGDPDGTLFCLDARDGRALWNYKRADTQYFMAPLAVDGRLLVASEETLSCLNAADGKKLWEIQASSNFVSPPSVADGRIIIGGLDNALHCLSLADGRELWTHTGADTFPGGGAILDGVVYSGGNDGLIRGLRLDDGAKIWEFQTNAQSNNRIHDTPAVANGRIYGGGSDGILHCLDAATGKPLWRYETGGDIFASPAVTDGAVFAVSLNNRLVVHCLDAQSGAKRWSFENKEGGYAYPVLAKNRLFVGYHSAFYCVRTGLNGPPDWPLAGGNIGRTSFNPPAAESAPAAKKE